MTTVSVGYLARRLTVQFPNVEGPEKLEEYHSMIITLWLEGILSASEYDKAMGCLVKSVRKLVKG